MFHAQFPHKYDLNDVKCGTYMMWSELSHLLQYIYIYICVSVQSQFRNVLYICSEIEMIEYNGRTIWCMCVVAVSYYEPQGFGIINSNKEH